MFQYLWQNFSILSEKHSKLFSHNSNRRSWNVIFYSIVYQFLLHITLNEVHTSTLPPVYCAIDKSRSFGFCNKVKSSNQMGFFAKLSVANSTSNSCSTPTPGIINSKQKSSAKFWKHKQYYGFSSVCYLVWAKICLHLIQSVGYCTLIRLLLWHLTKLTKLGDTNILRL